MPENSTDITAVGFTSILGMLLFMSGGIDEASLLADECISMLFDLRHPRDLVRILCDVIEAGEFPANLAALKLQQNEIGKLKRSEATDEMLGHLYRFCYRHLTMTTRLFENPASNVWWKCTS
jgi:hypothetical protein